MSYVTLFDPNTGLDQYHQEAAPLETSTTSTTVFSTKVTLTTVGLPAGKYRVGWALGWRAANANRGIRVRIRENSNTLTEYNLFSANVNETPYTTAFINLDLTEGDYTFYLDFRVGIGSTTIYVSNAVLEVWRIE